MAAAVIGRKVLLDALATLLAQAVYTVHLYVNNYTPVVDSLIANFTEASYDTYPIGGITPALPSYGNSGNEAAMSTVGVTFPATLVSGPVTIYGFYVVFKPTIIAGGNAMFIAAKFPAPVTLTNGGSTLPIVIDFGDLDTNNP